jgi:hypothetical protein
MPESDTIDELKLDVKAFKKAENWVRCIELCREALVIAKPSSFADWYWFKLNLAQALTRAESTRQARNVEEAIAIYHEILKEVPPKEQGFRWAHTHRCLGFAYDLRSSGSKVENLEKMIEHMSQALSVFTKEAYPEDWAITNAAIAVGYSARLLGQENRRSQGKSQTCHQASRGFALDPQPGKIPEDWEESEEELKLLRTRLAALKKQ